MRSLNLPERLVLCACAYGTALDRRYKHVRLSVERGGTGDGRTTIVIVVRLPPYGPPYRIRTGLARNRHHHHHHHIGLCVQRSCRRHRNDAPPFRSCAVTWSTATRRIGTGRPSGVIQSVCGRTLNFINGTQTTRADARGCATRRRVMHRRTRTSDKTIEKRTAIAGGTNASRHSAGIIATNRHPDERSARCSIRRTIVYRTRRGRASI